VLIDPTHWTEGAEPARRPGCVLRGFVDEAYHVEKRIALSPRFRCLESGFRIAATTTSCNGAGSVVE